MMRSPLQKSPPTTPPRNEEDTKFESDNGDDGDDNIISNQGQFSSFKNTKFKQQFKNVNLYRGMEHESTPSRQVRTPTLRRKGPTSAQVGPQDLRQASSGPNSRRNLRISKNNGPTFINNGPSQQYPRTQIFDMENFSKTLRHLLSKTKSPTTRLQLFEFMIHFVASVKTTGINSYKLFVNTTEDQFVEDYPQFQRASTTIKDYAAVFTNHQQLSTYNVYLHQDRPETL